MARTKGAKNAQKGAKLPLNTTKKGMPHGQMFYINQNDIIGQIRGDWYSIIVTKTHAFLRTNYICISYESPTDYYTHYKYLVDLYNKPDKTEEEETRVNSLIGFYTSIVGFHLLYFNDAQFAEEMFDVHNSYLSAKLKEAESAELPIDDPAILREMQDEFEIAERAKEGLEQE